MKGSNLKIIDVGPIKHVDIAINKINVFIGPQGSGKSTIVKILSFCSWVEKRVILSGNPDLFAKGTAFADRLESFHKLYGYFTEHSEIAYESDFISIRYRHGDRLPQIEQKTFNRYQYRRPKISYIPAERNIVASIPNWFEVKLPDNNIRSFMADWEAARKGRTAEHPLSLMQGKLSYHYEEPHRDVVTVAQGTSLEMTNTASGFQSLIPMFTVAEYCAKRVYEEESSQSTEENNQSKEIQVQYVMDYLKNTFSDEPISDILEKVKAETASGERMRYAQELSKAFAEAQRIVSTRASKIIIEEVEQNLFPDTQCEVVYDLLSLVKTDHLSLALTTHSPYVLFAINNCLMGGKVGSHLSEEEKSRLSSAKGWTNPDLVSVYQVSSEGELSDIKNSRAGTIGKHYFNQAMDGVMSEYYQLLKHLGKHEE